MTRRKILAGLLGLIVLALVAVVLLRWRVLRQLFSRPAGEPVSPRYRADEFQRQGRSRVVLVRGHEPRQLVYECLERLGAAEKLAVAGKKVLVKPNVFTGSPAPTTTNPEVVRAVCQWLREQGAGTVWVGDMSAVMSLGTPISMKNCGIEPAAREAGAIPVYFEEHQWIPVRLPGARYVKEIPVSEFVLNAERVINLPVIKSHKWATYSVCMKNFVGATHAKYRPYMIDSEHWEEIVSEINLAYRPDLNIVDGTKVMYAGGPWRGDEAALGLVLAGGDRVACDAVAAALMKTFPTHERLRAKGVWEQKQIRHAQRLGLGADGPASLELEVHHLEAPPREIETRLEEMRKFLGA